MQSASLKLPSVPRNANVRAYLAGGGATAALIAAAVIVFVGVAAFVGFNGLPFGADDSPGSTVNVSAGVPEAAADAAAPTAAAVAAEAATPTAAAIAEITGALPPGATSDIPDVNPINAGVGGDGTTPPGVIPSAPGPVGGVVDEVDDAAGGLGLGDATDGLGLGDATDPITGPIDDTVNDAVNGVGGALGNPNLGDDVNGTLNGATNGLLGGG